MSKTSTVKTKSGEIICDPETMDALERIAQAADTPEDAFAAAELSLEDLQRLVPMLPPGQKEMLTVYVEAQRAVKLEAELVNYLAMSVSDVELSVRATNCLNNANITTVGQLVRKSEAEMLTYRNFGKKSLNEIKKVLQRMGLDLGMDISETQPSDAQRVLSRTV